MNTIKALGIILIFFVICGGGMVMGGYLRSVSQKLSGFCRLIGAVRSGIESYSLPLEEIYSGFSDEMLEKCGFLNDLKKNGFEPALKKCDLSGIGDGAKDALFTVASGLGKSPKQDQIRLCDSALSELERDLQKERDMLQGKLKIVRTVTLTAAMMAVIILV